MSDSRVLPPSLEVVPMNTNRWLTWPNTIAMILLAGFGGFAAGNGHTTQNSVAAIADQQGQTAAKLAHVEKVVVPTLKKELTVVKGQATTSKDQTPARTP